ncbi:MAG TPA: hypothetical protein VMW74_01410 [Nitrosopumilaceae archaeon]|nr:hypothetical protein [Nitrosopumilaceae archaeon]
MWLQKTPTLCNDFCQEEYNKFYKINPELREPSKKETKKILERIIKNHYGEQVKDILDLNPEIDVYEDVRCEACICLGWDMLSIKIPESQLELIPESKS